MTKWPVVTLTLVVMAGVASARQPAEPEPRADIAQLWREPSDLLQRDLYEGPGGAAIRPTADAPFAFVAHKTSGVNPGYDVRDRQQREWSVKLGEEAQAEVTVSRILWAMGYHQPATYYLPEWTLSGTDAGVKGGSRFRTDGEQWKEGAEWDWYENPFVDTQEFRGLIVAQMLLANWDLKASNNRVYEAVDAQSAPRRFYIVRDLGSSLGSARQNRFFKLFGTRGDQGTKNDLAGFERRGFIKEVDGNRVTFDYRGLNERLTEIVTPADVIWACQLLERLPDQHWQDAFRAGGYEPAIADRFIAKIKQKIAEGLALSTSTTTGR